jgi:uncharacterized protein with PIN domain
MQIRLYLDEDASSRSLARGLRLRGIDVVTAVEAERLNVSDLAQLEFATYLGRTLLTYNISDFHRLHTDWLREGRAHGGIILVSQSRFAVGEQLRRVLKLATSVSAEEMKSRIEFLSNWT